MEVIAATASKPTKRKGKSKSRSSKRNKSRASTKKARSSKNNRGKKKGRKTASNKRKAKSQRPAIANLLNNPDSAVWVRKGRGGIIISKDSTGVVRAMSPTSVNAAASRSYAAMINRLADSLSAQGVRVYACPVPSQGEYYMPAAGGARGNERKNIVIADKALNPRVTMVYICDTLAAHTDEDIYSRTDHHWSPLGGYYGAKALAAAAGVPFRPLSDYKPVTIPNYVGTMYKFSGDPEINKYPEEFIYYMPPEGYETEFIAYKIVNQQTVGEDAPHKSAFFKNFTGGASYCTFMGGDYVTARVTNTGGTPGRRLLIVKDSFGNAMPSNLFASFEEVHVIDFRYFPHNLIQYIRKNGITDVALVNALVLAITPTWQKRYDIMMTVDGVIDENVEIVNPFVSESSEPAVSDDEDDDEEGDLDDDEDDEDEDDDDEED